MRYSDIPSSEILALWEYTRMSDKKFKKLLNSKDVTICAWCYSERSNDIIKAVR